MLEQDLDPDNAFYLHDTLRRRSNMYIPNTAILFDRLIEIFDRTFVFLNEMQEGVDNAELVPSDKPMALYELGEWKKGSDSVRFNFAPSHKIGELSERWKNARQNFKGMVRVNVSLVIRDALDMIATARGT